MMRRMNADPPSDATAPAAVDLAARALGQYAGERNLDPVGRERAVRGLFGAFGTLAGTVPGIRIGPAADAWPDCAEVLRIEAGAVQVFLGLFVRGSDTGFVLGTSPARSKTLRPPYNTCTGKLWPDSTSGGLRELVQLVVDWLQTAEEDLRDAE